RNLWMMHAWTADAWQSSWASSAPRTRTSAARSATSTARPMPRRVSSSATPRRRSEPATRQLGQWRPRGRAQELALPGVAHLEGVVHPRARSPVLGRDLGRHQRPDALHLRDLLPEDDL